VVSQSEQRIPWYIAFPLAPVGCLLFILVVPLSIPFAFLMVGLQSIGEMRFRRRMKERGRFIEWTDLMPALTAGDGTLIVEQGHKCPVRVWWTPDDVVSLAPCSPPSEDELDAMSIQPKNNEFVAWCHRRYTDEDGGLARITLPALELPPGLFFADFFQQQFPRLTTVDTVYCWGAGAVT
jgi:hypothetical protein